MLATEFSFFFSPKSTNKKTGAIPQVYTAPNSCPTRCPFKGHGCYGENWGTNFQWARAEVDSGEAVNILTLARFVESLPYGTLLRHNVAGDICTPDTSDINGALLAHLVVAYQSVRAYIYTHADPFNPENIRLAKMATLHGFTVNFSCETMAEADTVIRSGGLAVLTVTEPPKAGDCTPDGHRLVQCPNETHGIQCCKCKLCARPDRKTVICLTAHGTRQKKAREAIWLKKAEAGETE